jgi:hypothetical protein
MVQVVEHLLSQVGGPIFKLQTPVPLKKNL